MSDDTDTPNGRLAAMAITTDMAVPQELVDEIVAGDGFEAGRSVSLKGPRECGSPG